MNVKYEDGFFAKSPVFSPNGNTIYIFGADSNLFALNLNGTLKWKFSFLGAEKAPLIDSNGYIYFGSGYNLYCLHPDGSVKWIFNDFIMGSYSMPSIDKNGNIYAIGYEITQLGVENLLISIDNDGNFKWKYNFDFIEPDDYWQPLICDSEGTVYVGSTFGNYYYAISSEGELKWKLPLNDYQVDNTGAIAEDGTLYIGVHKSSLFNQNENNLIAIRDTNLNGVTDEVIITNYKLEQNYPNPFNAKTTIRFTLSKPGYATLNIYNTIGKKVVTLANKTFSAGVNKIEWDAEQFASGVYYYRLQVGKRVETKKCILLK